VIEQCVCGEYPEVKLHRSVHYALESWEAHCKGCYRQVSGWPDTEKQAITAWNEQAIKDKARRDSKDKLIYDLEHGNCHGRALARILKAVERIT
jgi:hypothetical protein